MRGREFLGWLLGALAALVILGLAAVLSPLPHVEPHPEALAPLQPPVATPVEESAATLAQEASPARTAAQETAPPPAVAPGTVEADGAEAAAPVAPAAAETAPAAAPPAETIPAGTAPAPTAGAQAVTTQPAPAQTAQPAQDTAATPPLATAPDAAPEGPAEVPPGPDPAATGTADAPAASPALSDAASATGTPPSEAATAPEAATPDAAPDQPATSAAATQSPDASAAPAPSAPEPAPEPAPDAAPPSVSAEAPMAEGAPATVASTPQPVPDTAPPAVAETGAPAAPDAETAPAVAPAPAHQTLQEPAAVPTVAPAAETAPAGAVADAPTLPPGSSAPPEGAAPAVAPDKPRVLTLGPDASPKPGALATLQDNRPSTLPGAGSLVDRNPAGNSAPAATPGVLPQIGKPEAPGQGGLPQIGRTPDAGPAASDAAATPLTAFARAFTPVDPAKPVLVLMLRDLGAAGMDRASLLKLPFPVTVVLDPLAPDAPDVMRAWRDAGQEVVLAATGLPVGAEASDVAQTFQALETSLPETVAVIDATGTTFQNDRPLASLVVPEIQAGGRGLVTFDEGLDAADQIARRAGLPAARIFRRLDAAGESRETIRRYLDRAAFKAAQEGSVVVLGDTRPETVAAILEWTVEGRAASVNLAPLTAVLNRPR